MKKLCRNKQSRRTNHRYKWNLYLQHQRARCSNNLPISNTNFRILTIFVFSIFGTGTPQSAFWLDQGVEDRKCVSASGTSKRFILPLKRPDRLRYLISLLFNEYWRNFSRGQRNLGVNLTFHLHLTSRLRMNTTIIPLLHLPLWSAKDKFTLRILAMHLTMLTLTPQHWITVHNELQIMWCDEDRLHLTYHSGIFLGYPSGRTV